jgi:hypothetical protein
VPFPKDLNFADDPGDLVLHGCCRALVCEALALIRHDPTGSADARIYRGQL